jgi:UDP-glucose 4-epimerase
MAWLITGGSGYLGSNLIKELVGDDIGFHILDIAKPGFKFIESNEKSYTTIDIRSPLASFNFLDGVEFKGLIHLAALKDATESSHLGSEYWSVNVTGSSNIVELANYLGIKRILFISSAAVYGQLDSSTSKISELAPCLPVNNYGRTKLAAEFMLKAQADLCDLKITSFRLFNLVGGIEPKGMSPSVQGFPKRLFAQHQNKEPINIYLANKKTDDETCVRDYVNVADVIDAIQLWMVNSNTEHHFQIYNVASGVGTSTLNVLREFERVLDQKIEFDLKPARSDEAAVSVADISKMYRDFSWNPQKNITDSVLDVISQSTSNA